MKAKTEEKRAASAAREIRLEELEARWPALIAMVAAGCLYLALPAPLSVGPGWLLLAVVAALLIPIVFLYRNAKIQMIQFQRMLTLIANAAITVAMVASLILLIRGIPEHRYPPIVLLRSATSLWVTNLLVFAVWYWKLDAGGPLGRLQRRGKLNSAFLFPQMLDGGNAASWSPEFMDYLFLAFNTNTAFSPTDTAVLSRWGKAGMMLQALISLAIAAVLAARAVNIF